MQHPENRPNQTIYIHNINEKIKKNELRAQLYELFTEFGKIHDIVAMRTNKMRGQAFIAFSDTNSASLAKRKMQGFLFQQKPLKIEFAKKKSYAIAKLDGTFRPNILRSKRKKTNTEEKANETKKEKQNPKKEKKNQENNQRKEVVENISLEPEDLGTPNHILFVENLPLDANEMMMSIIFKQYIGFVNVEMLPPSNTGRAFVEFEKEEQATQVLSILQNFQITDQYFMKISYAKK
ncbi:u1 small nuclear ribonucleoprotein a [Anaeramoeba ignava]|uniref:U1 small nuclear ribonucleoprotein a n=1 Tax=Anaeramoeba ignava TaxID=1746090 RepID=A0A9Q0R844_ANAIG|nr:u1 small nuclear ribonucleoprotein a [Anaeramoeba ignava]